MLAEAKAEELVGVYEQQPAYTVQVKYYAVCLIGCPWSRCCEARIYQPQRCLSLADESGFAWGSSWSVIVR